LIIRGLLRRRATFLLIKIHFSNLANDYRELYRCSIYIAFLALFHSSLPQDVSNIAKGEKREKATSLDGALRSLLFRFCRFPLDRYATYRRRDDLYTGVSQPRDAAGREKKVAADSSAAHSPDAISALAENRALGGFNQPSKQAIREAVRKFVELTRSSSNAVVRVRKPVIY